jgi:penicillin-binding protein 1C
LKPDLYQFLQNVGAAMPKDRENYGLSIAVGGAEIDMRTLIRLYAMMANGGTLRDLHYLAGDKPGHARQMLSPEAALVTIQMLGRAAPDSVPFSSEGNALPVYWKTGTSSGFRDAWTAGLFGPYALVVWTGHFDGRGNPAFVGADTAAPLFFDIARALSAQNDLKDKIMPALAKAKVSKVALCSTTGLPGACAASREDWFIPGKSPFIAKPFARSGPEILSPRGGVVYVNSGASAEPLHIPLQAGNAAGRAPLYWFDDSRFIGMAAGSAPLFWTPRPGRHVIHLVDADGHAAFQTIDVMTAR